MLDSIHAGDSYPAGKLVSKGMAVFNKIFRAGAATSNITPPLGISLNGGMSDRVATHIHDELHARCFVLDDGNSRIGMVVCDSCMIPRAIHEAAKHLAHGHLAIPLDHITISATHTHSAATVAGVFQSEPDRDYIEFLVERIADGLRRAANNLEPAQAGWGVAEEPTEVFNRRWRMKPGTIPNDPFGRTGEQAQMNPPRGSDNLIEPAGPIDPEVVFLSVQSKDGRPLALLANYSLHYVGGTGGGHVSADYFAMFASAITQHLQADHLDPPFVAAMCNGTSGNINNIDFRATSQRQPAYTQMRHVAGKVANRVLAALDSITYRDDIQLDTRQASLELGRRLPKPAEVARAETILAAAEDMQLRTREQIYARETILMKDLPPTKETIVQAIRIGDLGIGTTPCETFVETGLAIKEASPLKPTFVISLANDYAGYLPTAEHHRLGGYETWRARSSYLAPDAEAMVRRRLIELLSELA